MTLVDTSVWVSHLRHADDRLKALLSDEQVLCHPFVVGELACGSVKRGTEILTLLMALPETRVAEREEVLHLLDAERLYGRGLGWVDVHLLAPALMSRCRLWTLDRPLRGAAARLGVAL